MPLLTVKEGLFTYFSLQFGEQDWSDKDVLDFGGNVGGLLSDPTNNVDEARYWCIEVQKQATEIGQARYPDAHWIYYNKYNFYFNPFGVPDLPIPQTGQKFDYIVAYSVFTSAKQADMMAMVPQLRKMLKPNGLLAFTFIDPNHYSWPGEYEGNNLQWRLEKICRGGIDLDVAALVVQAQGARWCTLINDCDLYVNTNDLPYYPPEQQETCHLYYSCKYLGTLFPMAEILPPVNEEMQHCCVIRGTGL